MGTFSILKGLQVALINMPIREGAKPNTPPLGPGLLAAQLRQFGASVSLIDLNVYRLKDKLAERQSLLNGRHLSLEEATGLISRYFNRDGEPCLIGLSGMITTLKWQSQIASVCRKMVPRACLVSGGGLATEMKGVLFNWIPELDAIVLGEGDKAVIRLALQVKKGKIKPGERISLTGTRPDLDALSLPAWDLMEQDVDGCPILEHYIRTPVWGGSGTQNSSAAPFAMERSLTTVSSRGCPYNCAFCFRGAQGARNYGQRSADSLIKEACWLRDRYAIDFLGFNDDNFAVMPDRLNLLATRFPDEVGLHWGTHIRLDMADDRLYTMAKAGCIYAGYGAESASPRVLTLMNKGGMMLTQGLVRVSGFLFPRTMVEGVIKTQEAGIHGNCTWIMGYPGEKLDDLKTSVGFILWQVEKATESLASGTREYQGASEAVNQNMFMATAYPGTAMFRTKPVRERLSRQFGLKFSTKGRVIADSALRLYVESLGDAANVISDKNGNPINFSDISDDKLLIARSLISQGKIGKILNL